MSAVERQFASGSRVEGATGRNRRARRRAAMPNSKAVSLMLPTLAGALSFVG